MSYNGSGVYTLPGAQLANGEVVSATENNQFRNDVATALNTAWTRDGQAPATGDIPMGTHKFTGLAAGAENGDSVRYEQVTSAVAITGGTISGTTEISVNEIIESTSGGFKFPDGSIQTTATTLLGQTVIEESGTWTKGSGTTKIIVQAIGGGGSGGSANGSSADTAGGGGAGAFGQSVIDVSLVSTVSVTIGAGGSSVSNNTGNAGGTTTFGSYISCTGGAGGAKGTNGGAVGGAGGTATNADINVGGSDGGNGVHTAGGGYSIGGNGGSSYFGGAGRGFAEVGVSTGANATGYGSGGGGSISGSSGSGFDGVVIVWEFA